MAAFIIILGAMQMLGGVLAFMGSASAIHEILGTLAFGLGVLSLGIAAVIIRLDDIKHVSQQQFALFDTRISKKAQNA